MELNFQTHACTGALDEPVHAHVQIQIDSAKVWTQMPQFEGPDLNPNVQQCWTSLGLDCIPVSVQHGICNMLQCAVLFASF